MIRTRLYRKGALELDEFPAADVSDHLEHTDTLVWIDLVDPDEADLAFVADELSLHRLALDDALTAHQRPKLDRYSEHLFLTAYYARLDAESGELALSEVDAFITGQALVTVHGAGFPIEEVVRRWDGSADLACHGVAFLLHGVLDVVVDSHFEAIRTLDEELDDLEELLFSESPQGNAVQRRTYELRKSVVLLRRVVLPMREVVNSVMRRDLAVLDSAMAPYYQDVYDHVLRASEWTESLRDLLATALETHLTIQGNRLNTVMKKVTGWAAIIAVPTAITGFYGQNVPYPGFGHVGGFWASSATIVLLSGLLYVVFRRRDWI
jgi:magnesium transporter